jgi:hypothetical protein
MAIRAGCFRLHLSTAVILMICTGGLIGLNLRYECHLWFIARDKVAEGRGIDREFYESIDSPMHFFYAWHAVDTGWPTGWKRRILQEKGYYQPSLLGKESASRGVNSRNIVINVCVGLAILASIWFLAEYWARRRREPQKKRQAQA